MTDNEKQQIARVNFDQLDLSLLTTSQLEFLRDEAARLLAVRRQACPACRRKEAQP